MHSFTLTYSYIVETKEPEVTNNEDGYSDVQGDYFGNGPSWK